MSAYLDWQVGDRVVCVDAPKRTRDHFYGVENLPQAGKVYTIRGIGPFASPRYSGVLVRLQELRNPVIDYVAGFIEAAFDASRFRKVQPRKTDIAIFERFLNDAHAPIREEV